MEPWEGAFLGPACLRRPVACSPAERLAVGMLQPEADAVECQARRLAAAVLVALAVRPELHWVVVRLWGEAHSLYMKATGEVVTSQNTQNVMGATVRLPADGCGTGAVMTPGMYC